MTYDLDRELGENPVMVVIRGASADEAVRLSQEAWRLGRVS